MFRRLWTLWVLGVIGCHSGGQIPATPQKSAEPPLRMALIAAHRTLSSDSSPDDDADRRRLAQAIADRTHAEVLVLQTTLSLNDDKARLRAAEKGTDLVLNISHPSMEPDTFSLATLRWVTTGERLGDTSIRREHTNSAIVEKLASWASELMASQSSPVRFNLEKLAVGLRRENDCAGLLSILSSVDKIPGEDSEAVETARSLCDGELAAKASGQPNAFYRLRLRFENVSARIQERISEGSRTTGLDRKVQLLTPQLTDLIVACAGQCQNGGIRLLIPFQKNLYLRLRGQNKNPLSPFQDIGSALLELRANILKGSDQTFPVEIRVQDAAGSEAKIWVTGSPSNTELKLAADQPDFFAF